MKRILLVATLVSLFVLAFASVALAYNGTPVTPVIGTNTHFDEPVAGATPHGGFATTTDYCKQCHAVHGAAGTRHLLRNDSESEDCAYCHSKESAGAGANVYTENVNNGHTPGWLATDKFTSGYSVRDLASTAGTNTSGLQTLMPDSSNGRGQSEGYAALYKSGDYSFECNSCHQQHGQNVIPFSFKSVNTANVGITGTVLYDDSTKILRARPARQFGSPTYGVVSAAAGAATFTDAVSGVTGRDYNMTEWCAQCHDNNVLGTTAMAGKATHGTYALPATGTGNAVDGSMPGCYNCHKESVDFPHSGASTSYALLKSGLVTANVGTKGSTYDAAKLDSVCLDCHLTALNPVGGNVSGGDNPGLNTVGGAGIYN